MWGDKINSIFVDASFISWDEKTNGQGSCLHEPVASLVLLFGCVELQPGDPTHFYGHEARRRGDNQPTLTHYGYEPRRRHATGLRFYGNEARWRNSQVIECYPKFATSDQLQRSWFI